MSSPSTRGDHPAQFTSNRRVAQQITYAMSSCVINSVVLRIWGFSVEDSGDFLPQQDPRPRTGRNWSNIAIWAAASAAIAVFLSACGVWLASRPVPRGVEVIVTSPIAAKPAVVHVTGSVVNPGVYTLRLDARVLDAIEAAGGLLDSASTDNLNLAQLVVDGQQIFVSHSATPTIDTVIASGRTQV